MKFNVTILVLITLTSYIFAYYDENEFIFKDINTTTVLNRLFDYPIVTYNDTDITQKKPLALWKPNYAEKIYCDEINGYCMTWVDTVFYFDENKALFIFETWGGGCHGCSAIIGLAMFTKQVGYWRMNSFSKMSFRSGHSGESGDFSLCKLGDDFYSLCVKEPSYMAQGYASKDILYFSLDGPPLAEFKNIFECELYFSNEAAVLEKGYTEETKIYIVPSTPYYKIIETSEKQIIFNIA